MDLILVDDVLSSSAPHTYRQLWHLADKSNPIIGASSIWTRRPRGNVLVQQLNGKPALRLISGSTSPIQGWISRHYGRKVKAPVVEGIVRGRTVRYLTLIAVATGRPTVRVSGLEVRPGGFGLTLTVGSRVEQVLVDGSRIEVTPLSEG